MFTQLIENDLWLGSKILQCMPWVELLKFPRYGYEEFQPPLEIKGEFKLEELFVVSAFPPEASFPNLEMLHFKGPVTNPKSLDILTSFTQISFLHICFAPMSDVTKFLRRIGTKLEEVFLHKITGQFDLAEVFFYCPNLSLFNASFCPSLISYDDQSEFWPKISSCNFRQLKRFSLIHGKVPPDFIKFVLEAPLIESIDVSYDCVVHEVVQAARELTAEKLQHLQHFIVHLYPGEFDQDLVALLFKYIVCCAPRLANLHILSKCPKHDFQL
jgi:hypothetical protein